MHLKVRGLSDRFTNRPEMLCKHKNNFSMAAMHAKKRTLRGGMDLRKRSCLKHTVQLYATKFNTNLHQSYIFGVKI